MAKKKGSAAPSWDKIGEMIGKKMEKGFKDKDCCGGSWTDWCKDKSSDNGFFGRVLFVVGIYLILSSLGLLNGIAPWVLWLTGIGFALMKF